MVFTAEKPSSIKGNRKPCSVVLPTERVLRMNVYSTTGFFNLSSAEDILIVTASYSREWILFHVPFSDFQSQIVVIHVNRDII